MLRGSGDSKVLGFVVLLLKHINKQKHSSRWDQGKGDSSLISNYSFSATHCSFDHTLKLLKYWTWQFVVIRPICSILMISLQLLGLYSSWVSWTFTIILNISVSLALYSLVLFYHVFAKELAPHKPLAKFLCIKGIVFFCFWQGVVLDILVALGIIRSHHFWLDVEHIEEALQDALVCVEMVFFSAFRNMHLVRRHIEMILPQ